MRVYFDTEFIDTGTTIDLISIGLVREDGAELYLESDAVDWRKASRWVLENVHPHLTGKQTSREDMAHEILQFVGVSPTFWAYFAAYDWVALCQLYGPMISLPQGWPQFCRDLRQALEGIPKSIIPAQDSRKHHALDDARWVRSTYDWLQRVKRGEE